MIDPIYRLVVLFLIRLALVVGLLCLIFVLVNFMLRSV